MLKIYPVPEVCVAGFRGTVPETLSREDNYAEKHAEVSGILGGITKLSAAASRVRDETKVSPTYSSGATLVACNRDTAFDGKKGNSLALLKHRRPFGVCEGQTVCDRLCQLDWQVLFQISG